MNTGFFYSHLFRYGEILQNQEKKQRRKNYTTKMKLHLTGEKCVVVRGAKAFELATTTVQLSN